MMTTVRSIAHRLGLPVRHAPRDVEEMRELRFRVGPLLSKGFAEAEVEEIMAEWREVVSTSRGWHRPYLRTRRSSTMQDLRANVDHLI